MGIYMYHADGTTTPVEINRSSIYYILVEIVYENDGTKNITVQGLYEDREDPLEYIAGDWDNEQVDFEENENDIYGPITPYWFLPGRSVEYRILKVDIDKMIGESDDK